MDNPLANDLDFILSQTRDLWEELRGKRIFITGGTGFFGCWLLESFCWANQKLDLKSRAVVLTRNIEAFHKKAPHLSHNDSIEFYKGDICSFSFPAGSFSYLIHAFGFPYDPQQRNNANLNQDILEKTLVGLQHTLNFCVNCGIKKILFISTGAIYGEPPAKMTHIPEDFSCGQNPADSKNAYHEIRRMAETVCAIYCDRCSLDIKIARCFAFIGPYLPLHANFAIGNFIGDALQGAPIIVKGDGTPIRSFLYMSDLAIWLWTILLRGKRCSPYNVGSEHGVSIVQAARMVADYFSPRPDIQIQNRPLQAFAPNRYLPNTSKAKSELGLSESVSLHDALEKTIRWNQNNLFKKNK
jgi:nucleoside-diphosphate-sugar epimerase